MTSPDVMSRPSASRILSHPFLRVNSPLMSGASSLCPSNDNGGKTPSSKKLRSNLDLYRELQATRKKLWKLQREVAEEKGEAAPGAHFYISEDEDDHNQEEED